jgi:hypothetical protein
MVKYCILLLLVISLFILTTNGFCQNYNNIEPALGSPQLREVNTKLEMSTPVTQNKNSNQGMTIEELSNIEAPPQTGFDAPFETIPKSDINTLESNEKWPNEYKIFLLFVAIAIFFIVLVSINNKSNKIVGVKKVDKKDIYEIDVLNQQLITLEKLHDLKEKGAISDAEYESLKNKLVE